jgi:cytochrome b subunit of formate dehydrogenase
MGQRAWNRNGAVYLAFVAMLVVAARCAAAAGCAECHDQAQKIAKSAHAALDCATCHSGHEQSPHPAGIAKPACESCHPEQARDYAASAHGKARAGGNDGAPSCSLCHGGAHELTSPKSPSFRTAVPDTCAMCHADVVEQYRASVHGQALSRGVNDAPLCTDCHGEHKIVKHTNEASPVHRSHIRETCASCHANVRLSRRFGLPPDRVLSFDASFHGLAARAGSETVANCASCHGAHNILPSSNPKSTIYAGNMAKTCGTCHPGAGTRFAIGRVHLVQGGTEPAAVRWVRGFYWFLIPLTIGLMLAHNAGDWIRKLIRLRFRRDPTGERAPELRMLRFERVQHLVLAVSFAVLAWSGFALKYADQAWARPLLLLEGSRSMRSVIHRVAAAVFVAVAVTHLVSLFASGRLRSHWKHLLPKREDAREAIANFGYNIGLGATAPARSPHSYVEKAEYWAVVWGAVVMIASGVMLWANNLFLRFVPKVWLDVATSIHFYEAVLATLAILVWHLYWTIFDPDVYPLNTAFWTGLSVQKQEGPPSPVPHDI